MKLSIFFAILKSKRLRPLQSCVDSVTSTLLYTLNHSGWWSIFSAYIAHLVMNPNALMKFLNWKVFVRASLFSTKLHPLLVSLGNLFNLSSTGKILEASRKVVVRKDLVDMVGETLGWRIDLTKNLTMLDVGLGGENNTDMRPATIVYRGACGTVVL